MPKTPIDLLLDKSVRADEQKMLGGAFRLWFAGLDSDPLVPLPFALPPYWSFERDRVMRRAVRKEGTWGTAINIAASRLAAMGYEVDGDVGLRVRQARKMLGRDWVSLMQKTSQDYSSNDNGAFWEVVRASSGIGSKVLGLMRLSPSRCIRTGDVDVPVIYTDRIGQYHEMKDYQVISFSDMPNEDYFGVGLCATSRAYEDLYEHLAVKRFFKEKASGRRTMALDLIKGISPDRIKDGMSDANDEATQDGYVQFMGSTLVATASAEGNLVHVRIPFADLPSWFNQEQHEAITNVRYAAHLGIDANDLDPRLQNTNLGSGTQSVVLDEKQDSKGQITLRQQIIAAMNDTERWKILPGSVTFAFSENDLRDQKAKADIASVEIANMAAAVAAGIVDTQEARAVLVDGGFLPPSFDPRTADDEETLSDEDKANEPNNLLASQGQPEPVASVASQVASTLAPIKAKALAIDPDSVTSEIGEDHTGAMIALMLPPDVASILAKIHTSPTAEPTDNLHVTLVYLGMASDIAAMRDDIARMVQRVALAAAPIDGTIAGAGVFYGADAAEGLPLWANYDSAQVAGLRAALLTELKALGWLASGDAHGYTPHITLDYIKPDGAGVVLPVFEPIECVMPQITLAWAGERWSWNLNGTATFKAGETKLATLSVPVSQPGNLGLNEAQTSKFWVTATKGLRELGRIWEIAANEFVPQRTGETATTIKAKLTNPNTHLVTLRMQVGDKSRPGVAIRATLYGRKAFSAKRGKRLVFMVGTKKVFAKSVAGTAQNDWFAKSWDRITPQLKALEDKLGQVDVTQMIRPDDISGAHRYYTAQPNPAAKRGNKKRVRK